MRPQPHVSATRTSNPRARIDAKATNATDATSTAISSGDTAATPCADNSQIPPPPVTLRGVAVTLSTIRYIAAIALGANRPSPTVAAETAPNTSHAYQCASHP